MKHVLVAALFVLIPALCIAAPYVSEEEAVELGITGNDRHIVTSPPGPSLLSYDPLNRFEMACDFIVTMQVSDTTSGSYGGMREGEHLPGIIQTDNTSESIWMWSHYYDLTGSDDYGDNVNAAWWYCMNHKAYDEEGGDDPVTGYYRVYNCSWALRAEMEYRRVYGDTSYSAYAESCASYLCHHPMNIDYPVGMHRRLNPMIMGWAVGNLYEYGRDVGSSVYMNRAIVLADSLKMKVENSPNRFSNKEWAMNGGAIMWGIVNSYFEEYPSGVETWVDTCAPYMDTEVDSSTYQNAWRAWAALGQWTAADVLGGGVHGAYFRHLADTLVANDGDLDGGIPVIDPEPDTRDQSWVTNYLGYMCLDRLLINAGAEPLAMDVHGLRVTALNSPAVDVPTLLLELSETSAVLFDMYDVSGRRLTANHLGHLPPGRHYIRWDAARQGPGVAPGMYFYRIVGGSRSATGKVIVLK